MSVADEKWTVDAGGTVVDAVGVKIVAVAYAGSERERETREREVVRLVAVAPEAMDALRPFARFVQALDAQPLRHLGEEFYGIHVGTKWEAVLTLTNLRRAAEVLRKAGVL